MPRTRRIFVLFTGFALVCGSLGLHGQSKRGSEEERRTARVQAAYLTHLVKFTRWEERHLPAGDAAPKIVLVGEESDGFVESLQFLVRQSGLKIEGRDVELHHFGKGRETEAREMIGQGCQLVYVLPSSSFTPREISELTKQAVIFGESREFVTEKGGDVSFVSTRNRVKLVVSEKYFRRTSPKLSSKLVNLKSVVAIIPVPPGSSADQPE